MAHPRKEYWDKVASNHLVGRRIVSARYMSDKEKDRFGWGCAAVVLELDDGSIFFPSGDDEGNHAGALFGQTKDGDSITLPVL